MKEVKTGRVYRSTKKEAKVSKTDLITLASVFLATLYVLGHMLFAVINS